jgi:penicillin-binding protein activator
MVYVNDSIKIGTSVKKIIILHLFFCVAVAVLLCGCAGSSVYVPTDSVTQMDDKFSDTDLRQMATAMYNSITANLNKLNSQSSEKKVIAFLNLKNKTSEHISTDDIADKLQIQLLKAGTLRFVDRSRIADITAQFDLGGSGLMDPSKIKEAGKVVSADYFLAGDLSSIEKQDRHKSLTFYRLSMRLIDTETDEIVWADEFELKKMSESSFWSR